MNKTTKMLNWLLSKKKGVKYGDIQQYFYSLNHRGKTLRGYFCDAIQILIDRDIIFKKDKRYFLSPIGKLNINKPYTSRHKQILNTRAKLFRAKKRIEILEHNLDWISKEYNEMRKEKYNSENKNNKLIVDIREYINMVTRGVH